MAEVNFPDGVHFVEGIDATIWQSQPLQYLNVMPLLPQLRLLQT